VQFDLANVLVFLVLSLVFVAFVLGLGRLIRPRIPEPNKDDAYECGEKAVGNAWIQFNFRFYLVALVFVIFDVEVAFMFPVAAVFRSWVERGQGALALAEVLVFVLVLFVGLVYVWSKGDLRWFKAVTPRERNPS
jgi:NADH-quinone oxidoreductase subunit A